MSDNPDETMDRANSKPPSVPSNHKSIADQLRDPFLWEHDNVVLRSAAADEIERRDRELKESVDHEIEYKREIERLRAALKACETHDYRALIEAHDAEIERLERELRLAISARDYANAMLDKARGCSETGLNDGH